MTSTSGRMCDARKITLWGLGDYSWCLWLCKSEHWKCITESGLSLVLCRVRKMHSIFSLGSPVGLKCDDYTRSPFVGFHLWSHGRQFMSRLKSLYLGKFVVLSPRGADSSIGHKQTVEEKRTNQLSRDQYLNFHFFWYLLTRSRYQSQNPLDLWIEPTLNSETHMVSSGLTFYTSNVQFSPRSLSLYPQEPNLQDQQRKKGAIRGSKGGETSLGLDLR